MALTQVSSEGIKDAQVKTADILDANITTAKVADANITTAKLADNAITGAKIADNLDIPDNNQIRFGTGNDLQIYHDGTNSYGTEYATIKTGESLSAFTTDIDSNDVRLRATPTSSSSTICAILSGVANKPE